MTADSICFLVSLSTFFFKPSLFSGWITTTSRSFSPSLPSTSFNVTDLKCIQTNTYIWLLFTDVLTSAGKLETKTAISGVSWNYSVVKSFESRVLSLRSTWKLHSNRLSASPVRAWQQNKVICSSEVKKTLVNWSFFLLRTQFAIKTS